MQARATRNDYESEQMNERDPTRYVRRGTLYRTAAYYIINPSTLLLVNAVRRYFSTLYLFTEAPDLLEF